MDGHVNDLPPASAPAKGLRVRLVGGPMDGHTHVIPNADDVLRIEVPIVTEDGFGRQVYRRVMDIQGLRYVYD